MLTYVKLILLGKVKLVVKQPTRNFILKFPMLRVP